MPVSYFSRMLSSTQQKYTMTEKELLSMIKLEMEEIYTVVSMDKKSTTNKVFDKIFAQINKLIFKAWLSNHPWPRYII